MVQVQVQLPFQTQFFQTIFFIDVLLLGIKQDVPTTETSLLKPITTH